MSPTSSDPIAYTARIVAAKRAIEQSHPTPLFKDPYAAVLAGEEVENLLTKWRNTAQKQGRDFAEVVIKRTRYIAVRTRFFDDLLQSASPQLPVPQIVLLGAGLDTRAYRFSWPPNTHLYEVDAPTLLNEKTRVLETVTPGCYHHLIPGDLEQPQAKWVSGLLEAGLNPNQPTIWLLEGVVMYLLEPAVHGLLDTLSALSAPGSVLGLDGVTRGSIAAAENARNADRGRVVRHWQFGCDQPQRLLQHYGWTANVSQPQEVASARSRYPESLPIEAEVGGHQSSRGVWLVQANRSGPAQ